MLRPTLWGLDSYENPFITATSRQIIGDINALSRQLRELNVPRPTAVFRTLFQPRHGGSSSSAPWFQAMQVWSEIEDIYDSESFGELRFQLVVFDRSQRGEKKKS